MPEDQQSTLCLPSLLRFRILSDLFEIEIAIKVIVDEMTPPIFTIPSISNRLVDMFFSEICESPEKLLAYADFSTPSFEEKLKTTGAYYFYRKKQVTKDA